MNKIKRKLNKLEYTKRTMTEIEDRIKIMVATEVRKTHPDIKSLDIHCPFQWECKKSPFGYCVYDTWKDSAMNNCIYCGEPYERK